MTDYLVTHYSELLNNILIACFIALFGWEVARPWLKPGFSIPLRWWNTIALYLANLSLLIWLLPLATIPAALYALDNSLGLFNLWESPLVISLVASVMLYDMFHYWLHRVFHRIPLLWRAHRVHHSDPDVDLVTELKHHPLEGLVSALLSIAVIVALGLHPVAIILRAILAQGVSLMSHANIRLPVRVDSTLRLVIITPAMHRIHHSSYQPETDSNYGTFFSFWDRLFGTYVVQPRDGYENMQLGLKGFRSERDLWLDRLLLQPFMKISTPGKAAAEPETDNS